MVRLACLVLVNVHFVVLPAAPVSLPFPYPTLFRSVAFWLKRPPWPVPMRTVAPPLVQLMPIRSQPGKTDSVKYVVPSWAELKSNGEVLIGLVVPVLREKFDRPVPEVV